ncbi:hypothetical protein DLNHIDIE_00140 [Acidithiobacillus thiooxidans ATCC 19377]|uniref:Prepilin-type N-terminal cleavage/methylation domain-containing protein n=2 Tax=Acidithiobacillus thiooxidans TaxID=930 RepID=A0A543Q1S0_ACITH|nr:hypothetical protein DLNHIDIE_00140 [Acidithiobacillus thiooxidans ATCC 19377]
MTAPDRHLQHRPMWLSIGALCSKADPLAGCKPLAGRSAKRMESGASARLVASQMDRRARGFTLIEMLFAIFIFTLLLGVLAPVFMQALHASQETATEARMQELSKGTKAAYTKDAMVVDTTDDNGALVFTAGHSQWIGNGPNGINTDVLTDGTETVTPTQAYKPGQPQKIQPGFYAIAGAAGNSPLHLATDGFGQPVWVYVSPEMEAQYDGYPLYFHDVGFLSTNGLPAGITPQSQGVTYTCTVDPDNDQYGCAFDLGTQKGAQHDLVTQVSGYAIEAHLYKVTLQRMHKVAQAYSSYFTTQYLANPGRNADIDYFASADPNDGTNASYWDTASVITNSGNGNGPGWAFPGQNPDGSTVSYYGSGALCDVQPATWNKNNFVTSLGLSDASVTSAWGFLFGVGNGPNSGSAAGTCNGNDRDPSSSNGNLQSPPYTAFIYAWAPSGVLLADPVIGNY